MKVTKYIVFHHAKKCKTKATDKRETVVEDTVQTLKHNHRKSFTVIQYGNDS